MGLGGMSFLDWLENKYFLSRPVPDQLREFRIKQGETLRGLAKRLEKAEFIPSHWIVELPSRLTGERVVIKAGTYRLPEKASVDELLKLFQAGSNISFAVTFPEGIDLFDMQAVVQAAENLEWSAEIRDSLWSDRIPTQLGWELPTAEGLLFPETYHYGEVTTTTALLRRMVEHFDATWQRLTAEHPLPEGISKETALLVASLVEKEVRVAEEAPLVASVYWNRIRKGMMLQCDPTVIYSMKLLGIWDGNIRKADLQRAHPYNTYAVEALPPGPICNPGERALRATLAPAESEYLFFVSRNDGTHVFAKTHQEHARNVRTYQSP